MVISPDLKGTLDAPTYELIKHINVGIPIVPVNMFDSYQFNPELLKLDKWILVDYAEYGANYWDRTDTHIWGVNSYKFKQANGEEWGKFDDFVRNNPPVVYFKRELLKKNFKDNIYPIDFPCFHPYYPTQSKEQFNNRPVEVFFNWGHSHESRRVLHGNIFVNAAKKGYGVVDRFTNFNESIRDYKKIWATIYSPYWARIDMPTLLFIQGQSKLSVSLAGAGVKCFRHSESPINSVMVMQEDDLAWSYEWQDGVNCIKVPMAKDLDSLRGLNGCPEIPVIEAALDRQDLYDIYLNGVDNCDNYRIDKYINNYILPIIQKYL